MLRSRTTKIVLALVLLALAAAFLYSQREHLNREAILAFNENLSAGWFIAAFFVLPLFGFPISIFLVLAGLRFGLLGGMALVTGAMFFHNFAAYHMTHSWFRNRVRSFLERIGYGIPPVKAQHRIWFTALFAAIHGPPYAPKLYLLALTDIPFRIYFWVGTPVYILFALIPVTAGNAVSEFDAKWLYILIPLFLVFLIGGYWLQKRYGGIMKKS